MRDEDDEPPAVAARGPRPRHAMMALGAVGVLLCLLCGGGLLLARGWIARRAARAALEARGIVCDDDFALSIESSERARIEPCTCTMEDGPVASFELVDAVTVTLDGETPTHVSAGHVRVTMRDGGPAVDAGALGPLASMLGVPARIGSLVDAAARASAADVPAADVAEIEVRHDDATTATVTGLVLDGRAPLGIRTESVTLPDLRGPLGASATVGVEGLHGTASPSEVHMEGELSLSGTAPMLGTVTRTGHVVVEGTGLGGDAPSYRVAM